jgi:hypothetical protein
VSVKYVADTDKETVAAEKPSYQIDLSALAARWPSAIVSREKVGEFSAAIHSVNSKTMANIDSLGQGPNE